jgi:hypothetical protein
VARRISIVTKEDSSRMLLEVEAHGELELQERLKRDPNLLPIDEFSLDGPLLIAGRETTLASGSIDLLGIAKQGEILLIEFKTGPQNPDFRAALAQLLDYGSDLWGMSYPAFEENVAVRYFQGSRCPAGPGKGSTSLSEAMRKQWLDLDEADIAALRDRVAETLKRGSFHYVVVAQRFSPPMIQTVRYLNDAMPSPNFYLVEMVRFEGDELSVFEARTVHKPEGKRAFTRSVTSSESDFLAALRDEEYREALSTFFEGCRSLGLRFEWGALGASIRIVTPGKAKPVSVAWVFPPGVQGWMGLTDVTLGYDPTTARTTSIEEQLNKYVETLRAIEGAGKVTKAGLNACAFDPESFMSQYAFIYEALARLVSGVAS